MAPVLAGSLATTSPASRRAEILVVDDDLVVREVIQAALVAHGYEVVGAETCNAAQRQHQAVRPHAAILDYQLPDGDAIGLLDVRETNEATAVAGSEVRVQDPRKPRRRKPGSGARACCVCAAELPN